MSEDWASLNTLWFVLIAVLWVGYFFLEGFDFGVGILLPFISRDDADRRVVVNSIGPVWDGNEVWLLVAGGATFAAFPQWYATLFSGFYLALFLILVALIVRGVAFEYRGKRDSARWRAAWDQCLFFGSALPALLWGVAFANFVHGVPIDAGHQFSGNLLDLLGPYALLGGVTTFLLFTLHGANFLALKTRGEVAERAKAVSRRLSWPTAAVVFAFLAWTFGNAVANDDRGVVPSYVPILALAAIACVPFLSRLQYFGFAFAATGGAIALTITTLFLNLFPRVLVSNIDHKFDLTVFNASSTHYTLVVMTVVAFIFTPIVLTYQAWTYWVFRHRIGREDFELPAVLRKRTPPASPPSPGPPGHAEPAPPPR